MTPLFCRRQETPRVSCSWLSERSGLRRASRASPGCPAQSFQLWPQPLQVEWITRLPQGLWTKPTCISSVKEAWASHILLIPWPLHLPEPNPSFQPLLLWALEWCPLGLWHPQIPMDLRRLWKFPSPSCPSDHPDSFSPSSVDVVPWLWVLQRKLFNTAVDVKGWRWGEFPPCSPLLFPNHLISPYFKPPHFLGSPYPPVNLPACPSVNLLWSSSTTSFILWWWAQHLRHCLSLTLTFSFHWPQHLWMIPQPFAPLPSERLTSRDLILYLPLAISQSSFHLILSHNHIILKSSVSSFFLNNNHFLLFQLVS